MSEAYYNWWSKFCTLDVVCRSMREYWFTGFEKRAVPISRRGLILCTIYSTNSWEYIEILGGDSCPPAPCSYFTAVCCHNQQQWMLGGGIAISLHMEIR